MPVGLDMFLKYVTGFAKRGLPRTSNIPTLTMHSFRSVKAADLKLAQPRPLTYYKGWLKFQAFISLEHQVMGLQSCNSGCVWKTPFSQIQSHI